MLVLVASFFSWWYGQGWKQVVTSLGPRLRTVTNNFSVAQLLRTWFEPWKRIITYPGASLEEKMRAWGDNLFSRAIGFVVRSGVLFAAFISVMVVGALTIIEMIVWPLLPLAIPVFIVKGFL